ncbi:MAG: hypothetical protein AYK18_16835 [Theionarchaea archaeon DG-70]|nr:MAG: hypothetical protein AYK18_16835 [Theionarchaea archaeon DG-70]
MKIWYQPWSYPLGLSLTFQISIHINCFFPFSTFLLFDPVDSRILDILYQITCIVMTSNQECVTST